MDVTVQRGNLQLSTVHSVPSQNAESKMAFLTLRYLTLHS